jgi:hypothetical protein
MKKMIMVMAGVLVSTFVWANGPKSESGMAVVKSNASSYKLIYKAELASNVRVEIINSANKLVFSETIRNSDGFVRPYNFGSLPEGEYTIRLDNGSNWLTEKVNYRQGEVQKLAHLVTLKDGRYLLTVPGTGEDQLSIRIFGENGQTLYTATDKVNGNFGRLFNLQQVDGAVSIEVSGSSGASKTLYREE